MEAGINKLVEKSTMPDRVKSFGKIAIGMDYSRSCLGFIKPMQNVLRKIKNLVENRLTRVETDLAG